MFNTDSLHVFQLCLSLFADLFLICAELLQTYIYRSLLPFASRESGIGTSLTRQNQINKIKADVALLRFILFPPAAGKLYCILCVIFNSKSLTSNCVKYYRISWNRSLWNLVDKHSHCRHILFYENVTAEKARRIICSALQRKLLHTLLMIGQAKHWNGL